MGFIIPATTAASIVLERGYRYFSRVFINRADSFYSSHCMHHALHYYSNITNQVMTPYRSLARHIITIISPFPSYLTMAYSRFSLLLIVLETMLSFRRRLQGMSCAVVRSEKVTSDRCATLRLYDDCKIAIGIHPRP
jgi:hypothetical protein